MNLVCISDQGGERPCVIDQHGRVGDVSSPTSDWADSSLLAEFAEIDNSSFPIVAGGTQVVPPLPIIERLDEQRAAAVL
jgi:hypothetical protein